MNKFYFKHKRTKKIALDFRIMIFVFIINCLTFLVVFSPLIISTFFLYFFPRASEDIFAQMNFSGNYSDKNDPQTGPLGFSIYLSDTVRHFKNVQNTHNSGHISQNNTKNNNYHDNNNFNQTKFKKFSEKENPNENIQKNKNKIENEVNIENIPNEKTLQIPIIFGANGAFRVLGIKEYILEIRKDIENLWKSYEINTIKNRNTDNSLFPCFSTISVSNAPSSTSFSTSSTSSNSAESLKVKIFLRTRADGPTKVKKLFYKLFV